MEIKNKAMNEKQTEAKSTLKVGDIVEHSSKTSTSGYSHDGKYILLRFCRMKNPTNGEWIDAAVYCDVNDENTHFVRSKEDFMNVFKKVI